MAQDKLKIYDGTQSTWIVIKQPDEDGYNPQLATTDSEDSARTIGGYANVTPLFTVSGYSLKWTNIQAKDAAKILSLVVGKEKVRWHYFNIMTATWENDYFYTSNFSSSSVSLKDGAEKWSELSFDITLKQGF